MFSILTKKKAVTHKSIINPNGVLEKNINLRGFRKNILKSAAR